jgi:hypothetical protein
MRRSRRRSAILLRQIDGDTYSVLRFDVAPPCPRPEAGPAVCLYEFDNGIGGFYKNGSSCADCPLLGGTFEAPAT